jgi:diguanylate cyclase (GGDEF)-like protein/PAS domain S-box-containing protein
MHGQTSHPTLEPSPCAAEDDTHMTNARILIAEDDADDLLELTRRLERLGHSVIAVGSGEGAIEAAGAELPALALLSVRLGGAVGGPAAAEYLAARWRVPVLLLESGAEAGEPTSSAPPFGLLRKPVPERELWLAIELALHRHQLELTLGEVERWLASSLTGAGDAVIATDLQGGVSFLNPAAEAMTGWSKIEAVGRAADTILPIIDGATRQRLESPLARVLRAGVALEFGPDTRLVRRDGSELPIEYGAAPIRDERGVVTGAVLVCRDVGEREERETRLRHYALHDPLTGLFNRGVFIEQLARGLERVRSQPGYGMAVLMLDLDRFKVINDSLGYALGDQLLVQLAQRVRSCLRANDSAARLGEDELIILIDDLTEAVDAMRVAERIHHALLAPFRLGEREVFASASIGIARVAPHYQRPDDVIRDADTALDRAKGKGRGCTVLFDPLMHEQKVAQLKRETALRYALERGELRVQFQPIVALDGVALRGFEALVRWQHPEWGLIGPNDFVPLAEETGLIVPIGWWVLGEACRCLGDWQREHPGARGLTVSVNLSARQVRHPELLAQVVRALETSGVSPRDLCLEVTETTLMEHADEVLGGLSELRALGISLHLDDFGTGYSSLSMLQRIPVSVVKIDRSFVGEMTGAGGSLAMVETITLLAHKLGLEVVAEGVEYRRQQEVLRGLACEYAQGYLFARPLDPQDVERLIAAR